jgi:hypothetical protein
VSLVLGRSVYASVRPPPSPKEKISFDDYKNCVLNDTPKNVKINAIRTVKMMNYSLTQNKLALSYKDDKRVWFDKTSSRACGHFRIEGVSSPCDELI